MRIQQEHTMPAVRTYASLLVAVLGLSACAMTVQPGMSQQEVLAHYGKPSRELPYGTGTRLQYSRQPAGQSAVMVDLDAAGKVLRVREVLNPAEFSKIEVGKWTRADVEREFGPPARIDGVASWSGPIMNYRWLDVGHDMFFWVYLDSANVVQRVGQGPELRIEMKEH
jgi:hypothetical protein